MERGYAMTAKVILVCSEGDVKKIYLDHIKPLGVEVHTVSSLGGLHKLLTKNSYNGLMIDIKSKIKSPYSEKILTHDILDLFPVVQLKYDEKTGIIQTLYFGQSSGGGTIDDFINRECRAFQARSIRSSLRKEIHFNIILSKNGDFSQENTRRSITIDVSNGGAFIYSTDSWKIEEEVMFVIKELKDNRPIQGELRWIRSWGETMQIPGIGIRFKKIHESQLKEILDKGCLS